MLCASPVNPMKTLKRITQKQTKAEVKDEFTRSSNRVAHALPLSHGPMPRPSAYPSTLIRSLNNTSSPGEIQAIFGNSDSQWFYLMT